jgi:serine/threonine-protein kinase
MSDPTAEQLAQRAVDLQLLDPRQVNEIWNDLGRRTVTGEEFLRQVVRREMLTNWQSERLYKGETYGYFYGPNKVLYLVGTGTFSRVYRAQNIDTGEVVAIKVLRRRFSEDPKSTEQFFREGEMGRRLRHPAIVPIYEVFSKGLNHYLVMEFVEGRNLREFVKTRRKIPPLEAVKLMADIASGIAYAHTNGICHRDLKMTNVLVSSRGQPKLVDFGLASMGDQSGEEGANPRTIDYAGLEKATGTRKDDPRSDIFFLGCIFYHMLCGVPPLAETKDRSIRLSKGRYLDIKPITQLESDLPAGVVHVVNKSMEPYAERRYQSPTEMLLDLKKLGHRLQNAADNPAAAAAERAGGSDTTELDSELMGSQIAAADRRVVMVIESNIESQDALRTGLKRSGYRVLVMSDAERALTRFENEDKVADCVVFSTGEIGRPCFDAFNRFANDEKTRDIPAVLLLGGSQAAWKSKANLAAHRIVVGMPIKLKQFREALAELMLPKRGEQPTPASS